MDIQRFFALVEELLESESGSVRENMNLSDLSGWDSVAVVSFLAMVDKEYGVTISGDEMVNSKTVDDLVSLIQKKVYNV
jgi:acyl carrier protein